VATPFQAKYKSLCLPCDEDIQSGEYVTNHPEHGWIHEECVHVADTIVMVSESNGAAFDSFNRGRAPVAILPRGKTAKDRCNTCFQVPASNGVCGCQ
jgi:hypothetical protein